jgi:MinD superfamily P-loop ATPase
MKKIAITGGKGGVGKSFISILLALEMIEKGQKVVLTDCDVECPNDYLLLNAKLKKSARNTYSEFPKLNKKKCKQCGLCAKTCRQNAIFQPQKGFPVFIRDLCSGCGACSIVCPYKAIDTVKEKTGEIYQNKLKYKSQFFYLITGLAKPGLEETGPVVDETKKFALDFAQKIQADYILFDTAAGTHCPVISALLNVDFAYCVTEPTPMGAYDLKLILELCQKLKIPAKIILNQSNLGNKRKVEEIAKKFKIKIKREIPYFEEIVSSYSKGELLSLEREKIFKSTNIL